MTRPDAAFHILSDPKFRVIVPEHALTLAQTAAADKAISDFANDSTKPAASTKFAKELMTRKGDAKSAKKTDTEESLRQARAERMKAVSDEALYDLDSYTSQIMARRKAAEKEH